MRGGFRGGMGARGGGFGGGGGGGGGFRGGFSGGRGGYADSSGSGGGRDASNTDLYAPYAGPDSATNGSGMGTGVDMAGMQGGGMGYGMQGGFNGGGGGGAYGGFGNGAVGGVGAPYVEAAPSQQIAVRNLPWSTAHDDLVELFETTGLVELAEILFEGTRSKGMGIVQFTQAAEAETAIAKFQGYVYGGRPLGAHSLLATVGVCSNHAPRRPIQRSLACLHARSG
jgi:hypothetical protein